MKKVNVVKIGGNVIDSEKELAHFLDIFSALEGPKVLIHGGGKIASEYSKKMGIEPQLIDGRRVTNKETLDIITMIYGGLINKNIVAQLQSKDCNALGLTGADGNTIQSDIRPKTPIDFGFVGDVVKVNGDLIYTLIEQEITPVFCAITHDKNGQLLNTNADTIASEVACSLKNHFEVNLVYCFEKKGVLTDIDNDNSLVENLTPSVYENMKAEDLIHSGMIPKLDNCFDALNKGVSEVKIGHFSFLKNNDAHSKITL